MGIAVPVEVRDHLLALVDEHRDGDRGGGEADGIVIRGLDDVQTTWNGRNVFTASPPPESGRQLALQDIPAALLNRVDVYKTRSSDLIESGLSYFLSRAGLAGLRRFPFERRAFLEGRRCSALLELLMDIDEADRWNGRLRRPLLDRLGRVAGGGRAGTRNRRDVGSRVAKS